MSLFWLQSVLALLDLNCQHKEIYLHVDMNTLTHEHGEKGNKMSRGHWWRGKQSLGRRTL